MANKDDLHGRWVEKKMIEFLITVATFIRTQNLKEK